MIGEIGPIIRLIGVLIIAEYRPKNGKGTQKRQYSGCHGFRINPLRESNQEEILHAVGKDHDRGGMLLSYRNQVDQPHSQRKQAKINDIQSSIAGLLPQSFLTEQQHIKSSGKYHNSHMKDMQGTAAKTLRCCDKVLQNPMVCPCCSLYVGTDSSSLHRIGSAIRDKFITRKPDREKVACSAARHHQKCLQAIPQALVHLPVRVICLVQKQHQQKQCCLQGKIGLVDRHAQNLERNCQSPAKLPSPGAPHREHHHQN